MTKRYKFQSLIFLSLLWFSLNACAGSPRPEDVAPLRQNVLPEATASSAPSPAADQTTSEPPATVEATPQSAAPAEATATAEAPAQTEAEQAPASTVVTLNLSGGFVGFCDSLTIAETGQYLLQSCRSETISGQLEPADLELLQGWHHDLADFELTFEDNPGGPDNLTSELVFKGQGTAEADATQQQIIFDWTNGVLVQARPQPVAAPPTPEPPPVDPAGLCPEVKRPAMLVANYDQPNGLILIDPASQVQCDILLYQPPFGRIMTAAGHLYYPVFDPEAQTITIWQLAPDDSQAPLTFTSVPMEQFGPFNFVLSDDGSRIAWARTTIDSEVDPPLYRNDLWLANIDGSNQVTLFEQVENKEGRYVEPVRFSQDGQTLFYALQPDGLGGMIFSFSGRYDNLYSLSTAGGQAHLLYACPPDENPVCIGDISPDGSALAYSQPDQGAVQVIGPDGSLINTLPAPAADYVGRAVFGPTGNLAFVSATLSQAGDEELPRPTPGYISLIEPPYTGQPRTLLTGDTVATLWEWLDENRLAYGPINEAGDIGVAIVTLDGQSVDLSPNFPVAVLR